MSSRHCLFCLLALAFTLSSRLLAQTEGASRVSDETHILNADQVQRMERLFAEAQHQMQLSCRFVAVTFLPENLTLQQFAQAERKKQAALGQAAVLLAYNRSSSATTWSFSPEIWQRYPSSVLQQILADAEGLMQKGNEPVDKRLCANVETTLQRLATQESLVKQRESATAQSLKQRWLYGFAWFLLGGGVASGLFNRHKQQKAKKLPRQIYFPHFLMPQRLGAPCGGGICARWASSEAAEPSLMETSAASTSRVSNVVPTALPTGPLRTKSGALSKNE
jgi:hypothetical protein